MPVENKWTSEQLEKLSIPKLNMALWELDGWKPCRQRPRTWSYECGGARRYTHEMPNYASCHQTCYQKICSLEGDDRSLYADHLSLLCPVPLDKSAETAWEREWFVHIASPFKRTIALILTKQASVPVGDSKTKNEKSLTLESILKPSHFLSRPMNSLLQESEAETIAWNIMIIRDRLGGKWSLTLEEYRIERKKDGRYNTREEIYFEKVYPLIKDPSGAMTFAPAWARAAKEAIDQQTKKKAREQTNEHKERN